MIAVLSAKAENDWEKRKTKLENAYLESTKFSGKNGIMLKIFCLENYKGFLDANQQHPEVTPDLLQYVTSALTNLKKELKSANPNLQDSSGSNFTDEFEEKIQEVKCMITAVSAKAESDWEKRKTKLEDAYIESTSFSGKNAVKLKIFCLENYKEFLDANQQHPEVTPDLLQYVTNALAKLKHVNLEGSPGDSYTDKSDVLYDEEILRELKSNMELFDEGEKSKRNVLKTAEHEVMQFNRNKDETVKAIHNSIENDATNTPSSQANTESEDSAFVSTGRKHRDICQSTCLENVNAPIVGISSVNKSTLSMNASPPNDIPMKRTRNSMMTKIQLKCRHPKNIPHSPDSKNIFEHAEHSKKEASDTEMIRRSMTPQLPNPLQEQNTKPRQLPNRKSSTTVTHSTDVDDSSIDASKENIDLTLIEESKKLTVVEHSTVLEKLQYEDQSASTPIYVPYKQLQNIEDEPETKKTHMTLTPAINGSPLTFSHIHVKALSSFSLPSSPRLLQTPQKDINCKMPEKVESKLLEATKIPSSSTWDLYISSSPSLVLSQGSDMLNCTSDNASEHRSMPATPINDKSSLLPSPCFSRDHISADSQSAPNPSLETSNIGTNTFKSSISPKARISLKNADNDLKSTDPIYGLTDAPENGAGAALKFSARMKERGKLNPLAVGLCKSRKKEKGSKRIYSEDYFYREVLMRPTCSAPRTSNSSEEEDPLIDITNVESEKFPNDGMIIYSPAEDCAINVFRALKRTLPLTHCNMNRDSTETEEEDNDSEKDFNHTLLVNAACSSVSDHLKPMLKFIFAQRLIDLSSQNVTAGSSLLYSSSTTNANRLRESLMLYNKKRLNSAVLAHSWLLNNLDVPLMAAYFNLLRFLEVTGSSLSQYFVNNSANDHELKLANMIIKKFVAVKITDPITKSMSSLMNWERLQNVSLVLVCSQLNSETKANETRYDWLFRNLLPSVANCAEKVDITVDKSKVFNIESSETQRPRFPSWLGTSCLLNHKVLTELPGVSGMLNFAFPLLSPAGYRGSVEDDICFTYCPSLFVVGEYATDVDLEAMQEMRRNMIAATGLVVVGGANHNLFVSHQRLNIERVSQKCVERTIVEHTVKFMKQVMNDLGPAPACREMLQPISAPSMYDVDDLDGFFLRGTSNTNVQKQNVVAITPRKSLSNTETGSKKYGQTSCTWKPTSPQMSRSGANYSQTFGWNTTTNREGNLLIRLDDDAERSIPEEIDIVGYGPAAPNHFETFPMAVNAIDNPPRENFLQTTKHNFSQYVNEHVHYPELRNNSKNAGDKDQYVIPPVTPVKEARNQFKQALSNATGKSHTKVRSRNYGKTEIARKPTSTKPTKESLAVTEAPPRTQSLASSCTTTRSKQAIEAVKRRKTIKEVKMDTYAEQKERLRKEEEAAAALMEIEFSKSEIAFRKYGKTDVACTSAQPEE
ncbi:protein sumv-2 [Ditylenchus destructor]|nr:protein sumv-2 [Ditylenchus destructor]